MHAPYPKKADDGVLTRSCMPCKVSNASTKCCLAPRFFQACVLVYYGLGKGRCLLFEQEHPLQSRDMLCNCQLCAELVAVGSNGFELHSLLFP